MKTTFWLAEQWVLDTFWWMILESSIKISLWPRANKYGVLNMQTISDYYTKSILQLISILFLSKQSWKQAEILLSGHECDAWNEENWKNLFFEWIKKLWAPALVIIKQINFTTCLISQKFDFISKVKPSFCN